VKPQHGSQWIGSASLFQVLLVACLLSCSWPVLAADQTATLELKPGPYLLLDDWLLASVSNATLRPVQLTRDELAAAPLITAADHHPFQPYFTILRSAETGSFRLWYGVPTEDLNPNQSRVAYLESADGIHWTNAPRILAVGPVQFGTSVIDDGPQSPDPTRRYKLGWYFNDGLKIATSADGLQWNPLSNEVLLRHNHDINGIFHDPLRGRYLAIVSFYIEGPNWTGRRRITKQSVSTNLLAWSEPKAILTPDERDSGETQFYAMDGFLRRGPLLVGMVKVLRDDLKADDPPNPPDAYGIGYTTVGWTRDGEHWTRQRDAFLDRNPRSGAWDHAHAWIDEQVLVGDDLYLYYAGYKSGHKVNRFQERQIGLLRTKRDRYVGYVSAPEGWLRTRPVKLAPGRWFVNADASHGSVEIRALGLDGRSKAATAPISGDSVKTAVRWQPAPPMDQPVILEFRLRNATLFGFELE
jgi:hypothetical protein